VLYFCLIVAGVFAAWQVHKFVQAGVSDKSPASTPASPLRYQGQSGSTDAPSVPEDLSAEGIMGMGETPMLPSEPLENLQGEPGGFAPPEGAERLQGFVRRAEDSFVQIATYNYCGQAGEVADYYRRLLDEAGYKIIKDSGLLESGQRVVFVCAGGYAGLDICKVAGEGGNGSDLRITLIVSEMQNAADGD